jgi:hypothetical protein
MTDRLSYRAIGWLGIANFLLIVVPIFIAPIPPFGPDADLITFNTVHRSALILGNYLGVLQLPIGLIWLVFISAVTRQAEENNQHGWLWLLVLGSSLCATAVATVLAFFFFLGPFIMSLGQPALLLLGQLGLYGIDISYSIQALLLGTIGLATFRLRFLPPWLGYIAWLAAMLSALGTVGLLVSSGPLAATSPVALFAAGFSLPIWILLVSIYWLVHPASYQHP